MARRALVPRSTLLPRRPLLPSPTLLPSPLYLVLTEGTPTLLPDPVKLRDRWALTSRRQSLPILLLFRSLLPRALEHPLGRLRRLRSKLYPRELTPRGPTLDNLRPTPPLPSYPRATAQVDRKLVKQRGRIPPNDGP